MADDEPVGQWPTGPPPDDRPGWRWTAQGWAMPEPAGSRVPTWGLGQVWWGLVIVIALQATAFTLTADVAEPGFPGSQGEFIRAAEVILLVTATIGGLGFTLWTGFIIDRKGLDAGVLRLRLRWREVPWAIVLSGASVGIAAGFVVGAGVFADPDLVETTYLFSGWLAPLAVLALVVLAPLGEELFFRGLALSAMERRWSPRAANRCQAVIFGLLHLTFAHLAITIAWVGFALTVGLLFGWSAQRRGSIVPGVIAHAVVNSVALAGLWSQ